MQATTASYRRWRESRIQANNSRAAQATGFDAVLALARAQALAEERGPKKRKRRRKK